MDNSVAIDIDVPTLKSDIDDYGEEYIFHETPTDRNKNKTFIRTVTYKEEKQLNSDGEDKWALKCNSNKNNIKDKNSFQEANNKTNVVNETAPFGFDEMTPAEKHKKRTVKKRKSHIKKRISYLSNSVETQTSISLEKLNSLHELELSSAHKGTTDVNVESKHHSLVSDGKAFLCASSTKHIFLRIILMLHITVSVWRVVLAKDDTRFWGLAATNVLVLFEGWKYFPQTQINDLQKSATKRFVEIKQFILINTFKNIDILNILI